MKKSYLILIVAPALLLASCGEISSQVDSFGVTLPTGGTATSLEQAAPKLAKAVGGTVKAGAFSAALAIPSAVSTIETPDVTVYESLTNGSVALAIEGYAGTTAAGLKAAASIGFDSLTLTTTTPVSAASSNDNPLANASFTVGKVAVAGYIANSTFYLDISDSNFRSALISGLAAGNSSMVSAYASMLPLKLFAADILSDSNMPLLDVTSAAASIDAVGAKIAAEAETFDKFFTMRDYADGTTSIYGKFDKNSIAEFSALSDGIEPSTDYNYSSELAEIKSELGDNKMDFSFLMTFNEDHLLSVAVGEDIDYTETHTEDYKGVQTTHITSKASMALTLAYGDDVKVNLPANFDDYVAFDAGA